METEDRILVVDDELIIRSLVSRVLVTLGYRVEVAAGGAEAVASLAASPGDFDLVLLDATLPGETTEGVIDQLRNHAPAIPVVMMSGHGLEELRERFGPRGASGYLPKPFDSHALSRAVTEGLCRPV